MTFYVAPNTRAKNAALQSCLYDATKAQEDAAYCYARAQAMDMDSVGRAQLMADAAYWSQRARMFLFQTIGDGSSEDDMFEAELAA